MPNENIKQEEIGTEFCWKDPYSTYTAVLIVDENGAPIFASYGKEGEMRTRRIHELGFDPAVQMVMRNFADNDKSIFRRMRGALSGEYSETAERMQILAVIRGTF